MAVKTKDVVVDYDNITSGETFSVDAKGKNAIRFENISGNEVTASDKYISGDFLYMEFPGSTKIKISNYQGIRYVKGDYGDYYDIIEACSVDNQNKIETYNSKTLKATGTIYNDTIAGNEFVYTPSAKNPKKGITFDGGKGDDEITGTDYNDVIFGGDGYDGITGGKGNDTITGGNGSNKIVFAKGDGNDTINLTKGEKLYMYLFDETEGTPIRTGYENIKLEYSANKKDLIVYIDKNDKEQGSITLKNFATKDILNNATKTEPDTSEIGLVLEGDTPGTEKFFDLKQETIKSDDIKGNFTGSWLKDNIDASATTLYKKVGKTTVEKEEKDRGLTLDGGAGNDTITGTKYSDILKGGNGDDSIEGGNGNDTIYGENGNDKLIGGNGNDVIYGGAGDDYIDGGVGNDTITGGSGLTHIGHARGDGNDTINLTKGEKLIINFFDESNSPLTKSAVSYKYSDNKKDLIVYSDKNDESKGSITFKNFATKDVLNNATKKTPDTSSIKMNFSDGVVDLKQAEVKTVTDKNFTGTWLNDNIDAGGTTLFKDKKQTVEKEEKDRGLTLDGGAGDDEITGTKYSDILKGGNGDDSIEGGNGNDTIYGGSGNNTIYGGLGDDVIYGGNDNDYIFGGTGNDTITGGAGVTEVTYESGDGTDVVNLTRGEEFSLKLNGYLDSEISYKYSGNKKDLIICDNDGNDLVILKNFATKDITNNAVYVEFMDGSYVNLRRDDYDNMSIETTPDKNFTGSWLNDNIDASGTTLYKDKKQTVEKEAKDRGLTLNGGNGNNRLIGTKYSDVIIAGNGNDIIEGGTGNDTITGGAGENRIDYHKGDGNDVINLTKGENLKIDLNGFEYSDKISFGYSANKKDLLIYTNNEKTEYITLKNFASKDITNNATKTTSDTSSVKLKVNGGDYVNLKNGTVNDDMAITTETNKNFTGTWLNDIINAEETILYKDKKQTVEKEAKDRGLTLNGGDGNNVIIGTKYSDVIYSGKGKDSIIAGTGNDTIIAGSGETIVVYESGHGNDVIDMSKAKNVTIQTTLTMTTIGHSKIEYSQNHKDLLIYLDQYSAPDEYITLKNFCVKDSFENVVLTSTADSSINIDLKDLTMKNLNLDKNFTGTWLKDVIDAQSYTLYKDKAKTQVDDNYARKGLFLDGKDGNDNITGSNYSDTLYGGNGVDNIEGGLGNDLIKGGDDNDFIYGGDGNDVIYGDNGEDVIYGEEGNDIIYGGNGADNIYGGVGDDVIRGDNGFDVIEGEEGNDTIYGGDENDFIYGGDGNDLIYGDADDDSIYGDDGDDTIYGGAGDDNILGGNGADYIDGGAGHDYINGEDGDDLIKGGDGDDLIEGGTGYDLIYGDKGNDEIYGGDDDDTIYGGDGNDEISGDNGFDSIIGGRGNDTIYGGNDNDYIEGGDGNDSIYGGEDNDIIYGDKGDDTIYGDAGNDYLNGGDGNDYIEGGIGNDKVFGGKGNDELYGGAGADTIYGDDGNDLIFGDDGDDSIYGGNGKDSIEGGDGNDEIYGGADNDTIEGGLGNDSILGGSGNDKIYGGAGKDTIYGEEGNDTIYGDDDDDSIWGGYGHDYIEGNDGKDEIYGGDGNDEIYGGDGNDEICGDDGNDTIYGGKGDDYISGGDGNDLIYGNEGDDFVVAGGGNNIIYGDAGNDEIMDGEGNDKIYGGSGDDVIYSDDGNDSLYGGEGNDDYTVSRVKGVYIEDESGVNDVLNFEDDSKDKLNIVFNVSKNFDKSTDTISMVNILDDTNFDLWADNSKKIDGVKIKDNAIETIKSSDNYYVTSADIANLAQDVAAWLTNKNYADVNTALAKGSDTDVEALIAIFNNCNWQLGS